MKKKVLNALFICLIVIFVVITSFSVYADICYDRNIVVIGSSMQNTLEEGDIASIRKIKYVKEIKCGDIIVYSHNENDVIKRVIGTPGDHVQINNIGEIYINDIPLDETSYLGDKFIADTCLVGLKVYYDVTLKDNEYYTLGDNRGVSLDCRTYGPIEENSIKGKLRCVYAHGTYNANKNKVENKHPIGWIFF